MIEKNYDFRKRLGVLHPPRLSSDALPLQNDETLIGDSWCIVPGSDEPVLKHAVRDLQDYFLKSMNVPLKIVPEKSGTERTIFVGVASEKNERTARITATENSLRITGATAREAAQGCYRLEDELNLRGLPAVKRGCRTFTRMFSPRMTHSGWELEQFPDVHLDQIAHAGMDAIIIFISEPPDVTRNGRIDIPAVVANAAEFGLDVYIYPCVHTQASKCHPLDPGAEQYYEDLYGSVVKNAPGIKGMIFVGESVAFPSRDEGVAGYWWNRKPGAKYLNGFWPASDWQDWMLLVRKVTRKYNPRLELLFWTYNWFWAPEKDRLALIEKMPADITLHVTYEMGDNAVEKCGVPTWVEDYSITTDGPGTVFASEAEAASKRGIRLTSMSNTGGMTWDCGVVPYMPVPYRWQKRCQSLRESRRKWNLSGLMESHHYGFTPGFISELVKIAFTEEQNADDAFERAMFAIAERDFGRGNAPAVLSAWKDWSDAFYYHAARNFDQYGPVRNGPVYPMMLPGEQLPDPLHPNYEVYDGIRHGNGWKYVAGTFSIPADQLDGYTEMADREVKLLASGCSKLRAVLKFVPAEKQDHAKRELGIGEFLYHTARTAKNVKHYYRAGLRAKSETASADERRSALAEMHALLEDETLNVRETIPLVDFDSRLGWEPTMLYTTDRACLEWKLDQLKDAEKALLDFEREILQKYSINE